MDVRTVSLLWKINRFPQNASAKAVLAQIGKPTVKAGWKPYYQ